MKTFLERQRADSRKLSRDFFLRKRLKHKVAVGLFIAHETSRQFHHRVVSTSKIPRRQLLVGSLRERETILLYILNLLLQPFTQDIILSV